MAASLWICQQPGSNVLNQLQSLDVMSTDTRAEWFVRIKTWMDKVTEDLYYSLQRNETSRCGLAISVERGRTAPLLSPDHPRTTLILTFGLACKMILKSSTVAKAVALLELQYIKVR